AEHTYPNDLAGTAVVASAALNIVWGADSTDGANAAVSGADVGGVQDGAISGETAPNAGMGRAVYFTGDTISGLDGLGLTSNGVDFVYTLSDSGTKLVANAGPGGPVIFEVTLSDDGAGSYQFTLKGPIDHAEQNPDRENNQVIEFDFTVRDYDGDTATWSFD